MILKISKELYERIKDIASDDIIPDIGEQGQTWDEIYKLGAQNARVELAQDIMKCMEVVDEES